MGALGFIMVGGGALMVWAGFQGVSLLGMFQAVLTGSPLPTPATPGPGAGKDLAPKTSTKIEPNYAPGYEPDATPPVGSGVLMPGVERPGYYLNP